jgi:hypothetical protein
MSPRHLPLIVALALAAPLAADRGAAQVAGGAGASLLFFPLVVADGEHDTVIQLANRSTRRLFARCLYAAEGEGGQTVQSFDIVLVSRQSTHWVASRGRPLDPLDPVCERFHGDCDGAGLDPGRVPELPAGFRGDLVCVQLDRSGAPTSGNALRGTATLIGADGDLAKYEAVGLAGKPGNDADSVLCLGGEASESCPRGAEYAACPETWLLGSRAEGVPHGSAPGSPTHRHTVVVATCARRSGGGGAIVQVAVVNEFEQRLTTSFTVQRWKEVALVDPIFGHEVLGSDFMQTRLHAVESGGSGIVVMALSRHVDDGGAAAGGAVAAVPHAEGARMTQDRIVLGDE